MLEAVMTDDLGEDEVESILPRIGTHLCVLYGSVLFHNDTQTLFGLEGNKIFFHCVHIQLEKLFDVLLCINASVALLYGVIIQVIVEVQINLNGCTILVRLYEMHCLLVANDCVAVVGSEHSKLVGRNAVAPLWVCDRIVGSLSTDTLPWLTAEAVEKLKKCGTHLYSN